MTARPSCLIVCSASVEGVSAQSFIHSYTLTSSAFAVHIATPEGKPIHFVKQDDNSRRWLNEFNAKATSQPLILEGVEANRYAALLVPSSPGAVHDLARSQHLGWVINSFMSEKKCLCAVGSGVAAFCSPANQPSSDGSWCFQGYCMTGPSVNELVRLPDFAEVPIIAEDFIKDHGGVYSASLPDCVHVSIDRNVVTGQNDSSTLCAVQNLILLSNSKQKSR
ncbi:glutamine amidotransferase-like class 1 domain-containing protein 1 [Oscarella lobularis]|uniref:glutamine amidotransferase-like class 1 domain-containing protein 1 n=1 Tax=Oscarella lobularis TaxID=121494 RepID=UPI0033141FE4